MMKMVFIINIKKITKIIFLFAFLIIFIAQTFAYYDFPGVKTNILNSTDNIYLNSNGKNTVCKKIILSKWNKLKSEEGILGLFLHTNFGKDTWLIIRDANFKPLIHKSVYGVNIAFYYLQKDLENNWIFVNLEQIRKQNSNKIFICYSFGKNETKATIFGDSEFGSYKIPNIRKIDFKKETLNKNYKTDEKTPVIVKFKNSGFDTAKVFVFYDNLMFTKYFKLKDGTPQWQGVLKPNEDANLIYNFVPEKAEEFVISPAIIKYEFKDYVFYSYSNPVIVGARPYLNTISCNSEIHNFIYNINENIKIPVNLYNDSDKIKKFLVFLETDNNKIKKEIVLNKEELKNTFFNIKENEETIKNYKIYLKKENNLKECGSFTINFKKKHTSIIPYLIIFFLLFSIGIYIYYKYFL